MTNPSASATTYISPINGQEWDATEASGTSICTAAGTCANLSVVLPVAPGATKSLTFTLRKNAIDTAAVVVISGTATSATYTATSIPLADGDELTIKCVPSGTPTVSNPSVCWDFNGTTPGESIYGMANSDGIIASARTGRVLCHADVANWEGGNGQDVVGCAGALTKATIKLSADVGASGSLTFTITKNGVDQNGGAGTPDTRITFTTGTTKASATFSLAVAPGDLLTWKAVPTGTPVTVRPTTGVRLTATTPGQSHYGAVLAVNLSTSLTHYHFPGQGSDTAGDATEANRTVTLGLTGFVLHDLRAAVNAAAGSVSGSGHTFNLRQNGASAGQAVTILHLAIANSTTGATAYTAGQTISLQTAPVGAANIRACGWACRQDQTLSAVSETAQPFVILPV